MAKGSAGMFDSETFDYSQGISFISGYEAPEFTCFCCGVCCIKYYIRISLDEALGITARLDVSWDEWLDRYTDPVQSGSEHFVLRRINGVCVFLEHEEGTNIYKCRIHSFKPSVCRDWAPSLNQPDCRYGLEKYWNLTVSPLGEPQGEPARLKEFLDFLKKLTGQALFTGV